MAALTGSRNTSEWAVGNRYHYGLAGVEAATSLYVGGMVALDANGYAVPAQPTGAGPLATLLVVGIVEYVYAGGIMPPGVNALNQAGLGSVFPGVPAASLGNAGAISVGIACSVFGMDFDGTITGAVKMGQLAYALDDHTVTLTATGHVIAGRITAVEGGQCYINFDSRAP